MIERWHPRKPMEAVERVALERFCPYALRGALALGRVSEGPRGRGSTDSNRRERTAPLTWC